MAEPKQSAPTIAPELPNVLKLPAASWIAYDVANTIYAASITYVFATYIRNLGGTAAFGITQTISMVIAGLAVPVAAALSDRTGQARLYLLVTSLLCIGALAAFAWAGPSASGGDSLLPLLLLFGLANFSYQSALVFYNALLPSIAPMRRAGLISGLGVGFGYFGNFLVIALVFLVKDRLGARMTFVVAAGLFLLLAIPCFALVRERRVVVRERFNLGLLKERLGQVVGTVKGLRQDRNMRWFLLGNFFCVDVLNTAILFFVIYSTTVFSGQVIDLLGMTFDLRPHIQPGVAEILVPGEGSFVVLLGVSITTLAMLFGLLLGLLADRWGALRALRLSSLCLLLAFAGGTIFAGAGFEASDFSGMRRLAEDNASLTSWQQWATDRDARMVAPEEELIVEQMKIRRANTSPVTSDLVVPEFALERGTPSSLGPLLFLLSFVGMGAIALAGIWTAGRKVLMELAPRERLGEYFGLYGITLKVSVIGSTTFALLMETAGARWAMIAQVVPVLLGLALLFKVRSAPRK